VLDDRDEKGKAGYFINPLQFAQIERANRLLIVNCHYVLPKRSRKARLEFAVAADSVTFHLFESAGSDRARPSSTRDSMMPRRPHRRPPLEWRVAAAQEDERPSGIRPARTLEHHAAAPRESRFLRVSTGPGRSSR
jgi:hypothetical protein